MLVGDRQRDGHLTIVLLAELSAILPRHADRMAALLRKSGVVDDPRRDRAVRFHSRHNLLAHLG